MAQKTKRPPKRRDGTGDPPPLIKQTIWLLDWGNWRRHWQAILIGIVVMAAILCIQLIPPLLTNKSQPSRTQPNQDRQTLLNEDQIRGAIGKALHEGDIKTALSRLSDTRESQLRREECERVFEFCIKNMQLEDAQTVAEQCWEGKQQEDKLRRIEQEQIKQ